MQYPFRTPATWQTHNTRSVLLIKRGMRTEKQALDNTQAPKLLLVEDELVIAMDLQDSLGKLEFQVVGTVRRLEKRHGREASGVVLSENI